MSCWRTVDSSIHICTPSFYPALCTALCTGSSASEDANQVRVVFAGARFPFLQFLDPLAGMQHRRVVAAAKGAADLRQTMGGELLGQRHRDLPWARERTVAPLRQQLRHADLEVIRHGLLDV